jgi:hypothetical protein
MEIRKNRHLVSGVMNQRLRPEEGRIGRVGRLGRLGSGGQLLGLGEGRDRVLAVEGIGVVAAEVVCRRVGVLESIFS